MLTVRKEGDAKEIRLCNWMHRARSPQKGEFKREAEKELTGGNRNRGSMLSTSTCRRSDSGGRAGVANHLVTNLEIMFSLWCRAIPSMRSSART